MQHLDKNTPLSYPAGGLCASDKNSMTRNAKNVVFISETQYQSAIHHTIPWRIKFAMLRILGWTSASAMNAHPQPVPSTATLWHFNRRYELRDNFLATSCKSKDKSCLIYILPSTAISNWCSPVILLPLGGLVLFESLSLEKFHFSRINLRVIYILQYLEFRIS